MTAPDRSAQRAATQGIGAVRDPADVLRQVLAIQAQDYAACLWAVGVRSGATKAAVEGALARAEILRSWPMRGTLHLVAPDELRWMLRLLTPRVVTSMAARFRQLQLTEDDVSRAGGVLGEALSGGRRLPRPAALATLAAAGIDPGGQRGIHILSRLCMAGLLCLGPHEQRQPTFVLLDEWSPGPTGPDGDAALARLGTLYARGHGPVTAPDLAWWSGLPVTQARKALELADIEPYAPAFAGNRSRAQLLPAFDELLLGYRDRSCLLDPAQAFAIAPGGNGVFRPLLVVDDRVCGTWSRRVRSAGVAVDVQPWVALSTANRESLNRAAENYGRFLEQPVTLQVAPPQEP